MQTNRVQSVDIIRGAVMVLMAIDHVRVYSGLPAGGPEAGIFFTRWVTHFCAPVFVFLTGTSAFLYGNSLTDKSKLFRFLLSRGALLVLLELTAIRFFWTFNLDFSNFILAGVIWMIGWCMILLAPLSKLKPKAALITGVLIILLQEFFGFIPLLLPESARRGFGLFYEFIYPSGLEAVAPFTVLYVIVPWMGVMLAGYGFGQWLLLDPERRNKRLRLAGLTLTLLWIVAGGALVISNPKEGMPFIFQLLNQQKYPASILFLCMTLGPAILLMAYVESAGGFIAKNLAMFGRVPFFYYLLHIPVIHVSALIVQYLLEGQIILDWYATAPYSWLPEEHRWSLGLLYIVFVVDLVPLYFASRWYDRFKKRPDAPAWVKFI